MFQDRSMRESGTYGGCKGKNTEGWKIGSFKKTKKKYLEWAGITGKEHTKIHLFWGLLFNLAFLISIIYENLLCHAATSNNLWFNSVGDSFVCRCSVSDA